MKRHIMQQLLEWKDNPTRKPLLLRGARQVGKTYIIEELGKSFNNFISINLEIDLKLRACFDNPEPMEIINNISLLKQSHITAGETLLFIDEIQAYPKAIEALRYFKERMPELHVIAAGSLLEFVLHQEEISVPVGRIEYLYMYPCTFTEFLESTATDILSAQISTSSLQQPPSAVVHAELLNSFKTYMVVGGMPEAVSTYNHSKQIYDVQRVQRSILQTYRDDFGKYSSLSNVKYLQTVYDKAPGMVGMQIKYSKIDPDFRSRELKEAIQLLEYAGVIKKIVATKASGLPLITTANEKKFKLQFLDIGLVQCASETDVSKLEQNMQLLNSGGLTEQVVGQLLMAHQDPYAPGKLFFWVRDSKNSAAELDFIITDCGNIIPVEVKSSATGHLKSLHLFMQEKQSKLGIRISAAKLAYDGRILHVPFYLLSELPRLIAEALKT